MRNDNEALLMRLFETIEEFIQRMKRSPLAEELSVMYNLDKSKTYLLLRTMEARGMININRRKRPAVITIAPKKKKKKEIKPMAAGFKEKEMLITRVKVGDKITIKRPNADKDFDDMEKERTFEIIAVYPYCVLGKDLKTGLKRSISYGELVIRGLEKQEDKLEAMRK